MLGKSKEIHNILCKYFECDNEDIECVYNNIRKHYIVKINNISLSEKIDIHKTSMYLFYNHNFLLQYESSQIQLCIYDTSTGTITGLLSVELEDEYEKLFHWARKTANSKEQYYKLFYAFIRKMSPIVLQGHYILLNLQGAKK